MNKLCYIIYMKFSEKWYEVLKNQIGGDFFFEAQKFVEDESRNAQIFPPRDEIYAAFNLVAPEDVKVVILGQDPYHEVGQAHGLCFSVKNNNPPPSLINIYKEIEADIGHVSSKNGDLTSWAQQGVFLLNSVLTVKNHLANSHKGKIWEKLTSATINYLGHSNEPKVFILWGRDARAMKPFIDQSKHLVLECAHPSPLSAYNGFFGCKHFSKANEFLKRNGKKEIIW